MDKDKQCSKSKVKSGSKERNSPSRVRRNMRREEEHRESSKIIKIEDEVKTAAVEQAVKIVGGVKATRGNEEKEEEAEGVEKKEVKAVVGENNLSDQDILVNPSQIYNLKETLRLSRLEEQQTLHISMRHIIRSGHEKRASIAFPTPEALNRIQLRSMNLPTEKSDRGLEFGHHLRVGAVQYSKWKNSADAYKGENHHQWFVAHERDSNLQYTYNGYKRRSIPQRGHLHRDKKSGGAFILANMYFQYREDIENYLEQMEVIDAVYSGIPVVILADVNAKSPLWFSDGLRRPNGMRGGYRTYDRGDKLEEIIVARWIEVLNMIGNRPTYTGRVEASSNIDVKIYNQEATGIVKSSKVLDGLTINDHKLIIFEIKGDLGLQAELGIRPKFNIRKAYWERLKRGLELPTDIEKGGNVNVKAKDFTRAIVTVILTLNTQNGDITSCWEESARLLLETPLPDDNVEEKKQEAARMDMTRNYDNKADAIKQLDLLIKTKTMQSACQNDLFPLASCLLSLNLELGVPLRIEGEEMLTQ
uniref:Endonuclease/exonuclease/phosphatase domain-containing protein n=1 Tax=Timema douglasi TaxID=61478 RepID=A0A7R8VLY2_TIMDO|nr:unnamed protein product [Timema douglasi]